MESKKALELLRDKSNMFDLVISDVEMPDTDGFKLLEIGLEVDLPVIMLSAHSDYDSVMKGIIHGAGDYLVKPVGLKELRNIWQHVVKKNINSYTKNIPPSRNLLTPSESHLTQASARNEKKKLMTVVTKKTVTEKRKMVMGVNKRAMSQALGRSLVLFGHKTSIRSLSLLFSNWALTRLFPKKYLIT